MIYYTTLTQDGRIGATSSTHSEGDGVIQVEFPEGFDFAKQRDWRLVDGEGELVHDPLPEAEPEPDPVEVLRSQLDDVILAMADMIGGALV